MLPNLLLAIFILCSCFAAGQKESEKAFEKVEIDANTDAKQWHRYLQQETDLPDSLRKKIPDGTYRVAVQFIINKHGDIGGVRAKNEAGFGLEKIAEKIISGYKGNWRPATQCGRQVNSYKTQVIVFVIDNRQNH